jgi:protein FAM98B
MLIINKAQSIDAITDNTTTKSDVSEESKAFKNIFIILGLQIPISNININDSWLNIETKIKQLLTKFDKDYLGNPLLNFDLSEEQWEKLYHINDALCDDFQNRRELLLTRLDVTVQSFKWSERMKKKNTQITNIYQERKKQLTLKQNVKIFYILAARDGSIQKIVENCYKLISNLFETFDSILIYLIFLLVFSCQMIL